MQLWQWGIQKLKKHIFT